ncbi:MAG: hypothetical protein J3K34DRAFT_149669 [Monoraphidium minutum]|nr:MAG: hypothetical protein J3K34DRAFT_149669 [Monoraphidium minutum]
MCSCACVGGAGAARRAGADGGAALGGARLGAEPGCRPSRTKEPQACQGGAAARACGAARRRPQRPCRRAPLIYSRGWWAKGEGSWGSCVPPACGAAAGGRGAIVNKSRAPQAAHTRARRGRGTRAPRRTPSRVRRAAACEPCRVAGARESSRSGSIVGAVGWGPPRPRQNRSERATCYGVGGQGGSAEGVKRLLQDQGPGRRAPPRRRLATKE